MGGRPDEEVGKGLLAYAALNGGTTMGLLTSGKLASRFMRCSTHET